MNYSNSESILREKVNVYVGGDAYNYIINSNLSTSYFVLATFFGLAAIGIWIIVTIENIKNIPKIDWIMRKHFYLFFASLLLSCGYGVDSNEVKTILNNHILKTENIVVDSHPPEISKHTDKDSVIVLYSYQTYGINEQYDSIIKFSKRFFVFNKLDLLFRELKSKRADNAFVYYRDVKAKEGSGRIVLRAASKGTGIIAGGPVRAVCEVLGVKDIVAKSMGTSNAHNVIRATMKALLKQNSPKQISNIRNKKISEVIEKRG